MNASQERFAPPALTGDDLAAEEIKAVIDAYAKSIDDADIKLASEIWSTSEEASFIHPRGHERGWEQVKRNFYEVTMGAWFSERKLKVHNVVIRMYRDTAWAEFYWDFVAKFRKDGSPLTTQGRQTQVYRKDNQRWRIVHVHYSNMPVTGEREGF